MTSIAFPRFESVRPIRLVSWNRSTAIYSGECVAFLFAPIQTLCPQLIRERRMDATQVIDRLAFRTPLPVEAIRSVEADRAAAVPIFLRAIDSYLSPAGDPAAQEALFYIFHLLGAWREKSAYRPLARLLRRPTEDLDAVLGDFLVETGPRVMAAVFDRDPRPLYDSCMTSRRTNSSVEHVRDNRDRHAEGRVAARGGRQISPRVLFRAQARRGNVGCGTAGKLPLPFLAWWNSSLSSRKLLREG